MSIKRRTSSRGLCVCALLVTSLYTIPNVSAQTLADSRTAPSQPTIEPTSIASSSQADGNFLHKTISDFGRLPSADTLKWLTIGALAAGVMHPADAQVSRAMSGSSGMDRMLGPGAQIGSARLQLGGAVVTYAVGRVIGKPVVTDVGSDLIRANIVAQTLTNVAKLSVRRTRPDAAQYSFPSGHASVTFATATVLQRHFGWKAGIPAYGVASYVAASRIQDRRHFLSDVAFGAALGIVAGHTVTIGSGSHRFAVAPAPVAGGAAIGVTLIGRQAQ